jgi:thiol:disulfide interchange protein DsbD
MGAALGYALVRPAAEALLVFTALALGMALPYVVLCWVPQLTRRLPRPGPWMDSLKQLLAFPLYATVVWLAWVLGQQTGIDAVARLLAGLVLIAAGCWAIGRWSRAGRGVRGVALIGALSAIALGLALAWPRAGADAVRPDPQAGWQPWSDAALQAARAQGRAAFVDFTAAWCITCQVNKRLVLSADAVERRFAERGVVRLRADWTRRDPAITAALAALDRSGVPVYALYPGGGGEPVLLPEVLTQRLVLDALDRVARAPAQASAAIAPTTNKESP